MVQCSVAVQYSGARGAVQCCTMVQPRCILSPWNLSANCKPHCRKTSEETEQEGSLSQGYFFTLHCTALYCTALHCTALQEGSYLRVTSLHAQLIYWHGVTWHYTALHCTALHCTALHCTAWSDTARYGHGTASWGSHTGQWAGQLPLHCTALHCTARWAGLPRPLHHCTLFTLRTAAGFP
jgi:hypothetical protein